MKIKKICSPTGAEANRLFFTKLAKEYDGFSWQNALGEIMVFSPDTKGAKNRLSVFNAQGPDSCFHIPWSENGAVCRLPEEPTEVTVVKLNE